MPLRTHGRFTLETKQHNSGEWVVANDTGDYDVVNVVMRDPNSIRDMEKG